MTDDLARAYADLAAAVDRVRELDPRGLHGASTGALVVCYIAESIDSDNDLQTTVGYVVAGGAQPHHVTVGILTVAAELARSALHEGD